MFLINLSLRRGFPRCKCLSDICHGVYAGEGLSKKFTKLSTASERSFGWTDYKVCVYAFFFLVFGIASEEMSE